jgi:hypothetical protein
MIQEVRSRTDPKIIVLLLFVDIRFQILFTLLIGDLFTFPSRN